MAISFVVISFFLKYALPQLLEFYEGRSELNFGNLTYNELEKISKLFGRKEGNPFDVNEVYEGREINLQSVEMKVDPIKRELEAARMRVQRNNNSLGSFFYQRLRNRRNSRMNFNIHGMKTQSHRKAKETFPLHNFKDRSENMPKRIFDKISFPNSPFIVTKHRQLNKSDGLPTPLASGEFVGVSRGGCDDFGYFETFNAAFEKDLKTRQQNYQTSTRERFFSALGANVSQNKKHFAPKTISRVSKENESRILLGSDDISSEDAISLNVNTGSGHSPGWSQQSLAQTIRTSTLTGIHNPSSVTIQPSKNRCTMPRARPRRSECTLKQRIQSTDNLPNISMSVSSPLAPPRRHLVPKIISNESSRVEQSSYSTEFQSNKALFPPKLRREHLSSATTTSKKENSFSGKSNKGSDKIDSRNEPSSPANGGGKYKKTSRRFWGLSRDSSSQLSES